MTKHITLNQFVKAHSHIQETELDIVRAAIAKLQPQSEAWRLAIRCLNAWEDLEEYLEADGFKL